MCLCWTTRSYSESVTVTYTYGPSSTATARPTLLDQYMAQQAMSVPKPQDRAEETPAPAYEAAVQPATEREQVEESGEARGAEESEQGAAEEEKAERK
ncbi:hypothetical protein JCM10207_004767 [Rhodosporidiobolus poonsookiae]